MFPEAQFLAVHPAEEGGRKEGAKGTSRGWGDSVIREVFGISQIRPAHEHKPAGAAFSCGEPIVRFYFSPLLNLTYTLQGLSPTLLRMLSTSSHQFRVTHVCFMQLPHSGSSQSFCVGKGCLVLLNVHMGRV